MLQLYGRPWFYVSSKRLGREILESNYETPRPEIEPGTPGSVVKRTRLNLMLKSVHELLTKQN